jgi:hypothetical protein
VSVVRVLIAALGLFAALAPAGADAVPVCRFATGGRDLTLSIAMSGTPGLTLTVDWGDGEVSSTARPSTQTRGRAFLSHTYAAAGQYPVQIEIADATGGGCKMQINPEVPYDGGDDPESRAMLPGPRDPPSSDSLPDFALGAALAEADPPPRGPSRSDENRGRPEEPADSGGIGGLIRSLLGRLLGSR